MIAIVLPGSTNFHAVGYNQYKDLERYCKADRDWSFSVHSEHFINLPQVSWSVISKNIVRRTAE